ncbi:MAG: methyl-accepting chemotaxis protein [Desulfobacteraceae bacterium]
MRQSMSFRTKLLILLLAVGLIPLALMGGIALWKAGSALSHQTFSHLESMREIKREFLIDYFELLESQLGILRDDPNTVKAIAEFEQLTSESGGEAATPRWMEAAARYDPHFKDILQDNHWHDILLINTSGRIVYSVSRRADLGLVIPTSDLKETSLADAFVQVKRRDTALSDFAPYGPARGTPTGFAMARVKVDSEQTAGYVAFPIPLDKITRIMQERAGMGKTGETYLVGSDKLMRSDSYLAPEIHSVAASFADPAKGMVDTRASREALSGIADTRIIRDHRGDSVLSAYTPVQLGTTTWALIAEIDVAEAFGPVNTLKWILAGVALLSLAAIVPAAFVIVKPLRRATTGLKGAAEKLQVFAQQQSTSTTEQVTATTEISTTMEELSKTAQQISTAAANAASEAESTHLESGKGMQSLEKAVDGISLIGSMMEKITENILALGEKSQQMGLVLEIIKELAEQTTILSFNAGIEAAGAGETGTRFGAVAEQIMNLANKAGASTKEVRQLIEDVQKSTNKTVLITEEGMKSVNEGKSRISDTAGHFEKILKASEENMVTAKETEMAVTQQTTAIGQVTAAVQNVQVAAEDVKGSTQQTLETARRLLDMAGGLAQM